MRALVVLTLGLALTLPAFADCKNDWKTQPLPGEDKGTEVMKANALAHSLNIALQASPCKKPSEKNTCLVNRDNFKLITPPKKDAEGNAIGWHFTQRWTYESCGKSIPLTLHFTDQDSVVNNLNKKQQAKK